MLYFIRHGQVDSNLHCIHAGGECDEPLNETGRAQARDFSSTHQELLKTIDSVFVSPMLRTRQTADLILAGLSKPRETIEGLRELKLGEWTGRPYDSIGNFFADQTDPPGGETWAQFRTRTIGALRRAARVAGNVLVVAHGGVWFSYASRAGVEPVHIENCSLHTICREKLAEIEI